MKNSDLIYYAALALTGAYFFNEMTTIKHRWFMTDKANAEYNLMLALKDGIIPNGAYDVYIASLRTGNMAPREITNGLIDGAVPQGAAR